MLAIFGIGLPGGINLFYLPSAVNISISVDWMFGVISLIFASIYGIIALIFSYALAALLNLIIGMATDLEKLTLRCQLRKSPLIHKKYQIFTSQI